VAAKVTGPFTVAKPWKANGVATSALAEHADVAAGAVGWRGLHAIHELRWEPPRAVGGGVPPR